MTNNTATDPRADERAQVTFAQMAKDALKQAHEAQYLYLDSTQRNQEQWIMVRQIYRDLELIYRGYAAQVKP